MIDADKYKALTVAMNSLQFNPSLNDIEKQSYETIIRQVIEDIETNETITIAFDISCKDAADGCCPFDTTEEYECELCENCSNRFGDREDMGRDTECWKNYYLQEARKINS